MRADRYARIGMPESVVKVLSDPHRELWEKAKVPTGGTLTKQQKESGDKHVTNTGLNTKAC